MKYEKTLKGSLGRETKTEAAATTKESEHKIGKYEGLLNDYLSSKTLDGTADDAAKKKSRSEGLHKKLTAVGILFNGIDPESDEARIRAFLFDHIKAAKRYVQLATQKSRSKSEQLEYDLLEKLLSCCGKPGYIGVTIKDIDKRAKKIERAKAARKRRPGHRGVAKKASASVDDSRIEPTEYDGDIVEEDVSPDPDGFREYVNGSRSHE